jgi:hypothetical protein
MPLPTAFSPKRHWRNTWSMKCCTNVNKFDRTCLNHLVHYLGLSKQYGKKDSEVSQFLKKMFRTVAFTIGGSLRLLCFGIFIQSSKRQVSGTVLHLPARKLYWFRLQFSSDCLVWMFCIIIEDHRRMWLIPCPIQCTIVQCALKKTTFW